MMFVSDFVSGYAVLVLTTNASHAWQKSASTVVFFRRRQPAGVTYNHENARGRVDDALGLCRNPGLSGSVNDSLFNNVYR